MRALLFTCRLFNSAELRFNPLMRIYRLFLAALVSSCATFAQTNRISSPEIHDDKTVTFRLFAPKATSAEFYGDWMPLNTTEKLTRGTNGVWSLTTGPIAPGIYIYTFSVDGMTIADPVNPRIKLRARTSASLLEVPADSPELWEFRNVPHGTVEIIYHKPNSFEGEPRQVWVYKPPGYDKARRQRYPVLYLLHGSNDTPAGWTMVGHANYILDNLVAEGIAREMIVVMPFGHAVPFDAPREEQQNNSPRFERYLLEDLVPLVESRYRTSKERRQRAIVGLSMGGGQALQIGFDHLELFASIGAFSSAIPRNFEERFAAQLRAADETNKKLDLLWIGCGRDDSGFKNSQELSQLLAAHQIRHTFVASEGAHTYTVWRQYLMEVAPLLFR